jgi:hypothetical protein
MNFRPRLRTHGSMRRKIATVLGAGALAGIAGGVLLDGYILAVGAIAHGPRPEELYTFIASGLVGKAAYAWPGIAWLGLFVHGLVSIGWGIGYAYAAVTTPQIASRPAVSGIVFGVVVYVTMQIVEALAGIWRAPTANEAFTDLVAHTIFFGLPVAFVVTRRLRAA